MATRTTAADLFVTSFTDDDTSVTTNVTVGPPPFNPADADFDQHSRIIILWVEIVLGTLGGILVCMWLWYNRRRRSRVNMLILQVALTDLGVIWLACVPQLIWEYSGRHWALGNVMCKLIKFTQSVVMIASNYMIVVLSIDRHQAIRAPLKEPIPVWKMSMVSWVWSGVLSLPMLYLFRAHYNTARGKFEGMTVCEPIFRFRPRWERQLFLTFISVVHFAIPFVVIAFCYVRIFLKIAEKANEGKACHKGGGGGGRKSTIKPGKVHLQSTPSSSLPKAKVKTLKMTLVIVFSFVVCVLPYHVAEMILNFGSPALMNTVVYAVLGAMAAANSATDPFVFLLFNANVKCARGFVSSVFPCSWKNRERRAYLESTASTRSEYAINRSEYTLNTDVTSRTASKYCPSGGGAGTGRGGGTIGAGPETVEMSTRGPGSTGGGSGGGGGCGGGAGGAGGVGGKKLNYTLLTVTKT